MANVFLSHRTADLVLARQLADDLRTAGHTVWLDDDEVGVGDSIVEEIEKGIGGATYLVLCLSSFGVTAPWTAREWMSTLARQLNGVNVKILPVRLTGHEVPAVLADLRHADLVADWGTGLAELTAALK